MVSPRLRRLILLLWIPATVAGGVMTVEILLQIRAAATERFRPIRTETERLRSAYLPFTVQHLHPQYLFFFPLQSADRLALANAVCSLDAEGFREPGPAAAKGRRLAVLLGGSAAFGHFASSNDTTITSYLNRLQQDYFFVNAGVPSWNSTQELSRMAIQIAALKPALVVTYDGANDAALADLGLEPDGRSRYPPGTPENFDQLEQLLDEARHPWKRITLPRLFPEIANRIEKYTAPEDAPGAPLDARITRAAAARYVDNLLGIAALARQAGARHLAVFQPLAPLHRHVPEGQFDPRNFEDTVAFRDAAFALKREGLAFIDFSSVFDDELDTVPVVDGEPGDAIFFDAVHLTDRGSEIVARRLLRAIQQPE